MRALVDRLNETAYHYYVLDEPVISDGEWDALYDELLSMESETGATLPDSPTRRVGGEPLPGFEQHRHLSRLYSMDKAQSIEALSQWAARAEKLRTGAAAEGLELPPLSYVVEYKFDGLTINLTYEGGALKQAATRGNGVVGEGILKQVMTIRSIPLSIPFQGRVEIHGEGYMRLSRLKQYNRTAAEPLKNPRNGAAGALRNLDPAVTASRKLDAFFYDIGYIEGRAFDSHYEKLEFLREIHLPVSDYATRAGSMDEVIKLVKEVEEHRAELDFLIDGVVIKIDDRATQDALGFTDKFPRWAVAYKFEAEEAVSTLLSVTWTPGRTGKLTPLAHLEPVELAGATIRRATLNNYGDILRKRVKIGAKVWLRRSNDVIPEIMGRVEEYGEGEREIEKPAACPACGSLLEERGAHLFCPNAYGCLPQITSRIAHFASREAMDIDAFSDKTAFQLLGALGITEPSDLYMLTREQLVALDRFGDKKADNLLNAIEKSRKPKLDAFIYAIGIPGIGRKTSRDLAETFGSLDALRNASGEQLVGIPEIGETLKVNILEYFQDGQSLSSLERLLKAGVAPEWDAKVRERGALSGKTLVVTGTLETMSRSEAENAIREAGGVATSSVSKKTDYLVAGSAAGSKLQKAQTLGIPVLNEEEFLLLVKS